MGHGRAYRVKAELERSCDPEVCAGAAEAPEEIGVLLLARPDEPAVRGHELDREQVVDRQAELPLQSAHAAAERETGHAGVGDDADGAREVELLRGLVELPQERAAAHARGARARIDLGAAQPLHVDHDSAVARRVARDAVPAAAHGHEEALLACEPHGRDDVLGARRPDDQGGPAVDHAVPDHAGRVVVRVARHDDLPGENIPERAERGGCELVRHPWIR